MNEIKVFENSMFGSIRTAGTPLAPLFCLVDVCKALELRQGDVVRRLDKGVVSTQPLPTAGGTQQANFVNEDGLYDVILDSRKPEAKAFRKWITSEVLPSIRKTGGYIAASENESDEEIMAKALRIAEQTLARREQRIRQLNDKVVELTSTVEVMKPKANYFDIIMNCKSTVTTTQIAQDYGMSAKRFNMLLNEFRVQRKVNGQWILYNRYIGQGYVHSKPVDIIRSNGMRDVKYNTEWTQKGRIFLYGILKDNGIIPMIEKS